MRRIILSLFVGLIAQAAAAQEVTLRHALGGVSLDALATLVLRFNDEQKGKAKVVLESLDGVEDRQKLPDMALLDDEDARLFFDSHPRYKPLPEVMKEGGQKFDATVFLPQLVGAVDDLRGRMQGLPVGMALPALFYNKEAFVKAGLDPERPPRTWWEVQTAAGALYDAGYACPLTTSRFARVHMENLSSQHGELVITRGGHGERFAFNNMVHVKHLALLASWQKSRYFHYFGPGSEGNAKFLAGECAMLTGESGLHGELRTAQFPVGVAALPYYEDVWGAQPTNVLPDGAALWVLPGRKKKEYEVIARFVAFLLRPQAQRDWVRATGFLPMTSAALNELAAAGVPPAVIESARKRLGMPVKADVRTRSGFGRNRVRALLNEEVEFVWQNVKPAKAALDAAMERANKPGG